MSRPYEFRHDINGIPTEEHPTNMLDQQVRGLLVSIRMELEALIPRICGCEHENEVAKLYPNERRYRRLQDAGGMEFEQEIFPQVRCRDVEQNPLCAHRSENLQPDVLQPQLDPLLQIGVIDESWNDWNRDVAGELVDIDRTKGEGNWSDPEGSAAWARLTQQTHEQDVRKKITLLIGIIDDLVGPDTRRIALPMV